MSKSNLAKFEAMTSSSMTVCVRVRPLSNRHESKQRQKSSGPLKEVVRVSKVMPAVQVMRLAKEGAVLRSEQAAQWSYQFDSAFGGDSKQLAIYEASTQPLIPKLLRGINCTVFAYGATGAGKTHTMSGVENDVDHQGIIPRALQDIFAGVNANQQAAQEEFEHTQQQKAAALTVAAAGNEQTTGKTKTNLKSAFDEPEEDRVDEWVVSISYLEVYNEKLYDLLTPLPTAEGQSRKTLEPREDPRLGIVKVAGLSEVHVSSTTDVLSLIATGSTRRTMESTAANAVSSRSHAVLQVNVSCTKYYNAGRKRVTTGTMSLIDLAGSERASATNNRGQRLTEGANINKSLLALANCINALSAKSLATSSDDSKKGTKRRRDRRSSICVPNRGGSSSSSSSSSSRSGSSSSSSSSSMTRVKYRDSKLTHLLKSSLEGNCHLVMIACVNPSHTCFEESHNTLKYANRAKSIRMSSGRVNTRAFSPTAAEKRERQTKINAAKDRAEALQRAKARKVAEALKLEARKEADAERRKELAEARAVEKQQLTEKHERQAEARREAMLLKHKKQKKQAWTLNEMSFSNEEEQATNSFDFDASINDSIDLNESIEFVEEREDNEEMSESTASDSTMNESMESMDSQSRKRPRRMPPTKPVAEGSKDSLQLRVCELEKLVASLNQDKSQMAMEISKLKAALAVSNASKKRKKTGTKRRALSSIVPNTRKEAKSNQSSSSSSSSSSSTTTSTNTTTKVSSKAEGKKNKKKRRRHSLIPRPKSSFR